MFDFGNREPVEIVDCGDVHGASRALLLYKSRPLREKCRGIDAGRHLATRAASLRRPKRPNNSGKGDRP